LFLEQIGPNNANCIETIRINFPHYEYSGSNLATTILDRNDARILNTIQSGCANLETLKLFIRPVTAAALNYFSDVGYRDSEYNTMIDVFNLLMSYLRAFSSLKKIIIEFKMSEYVGIKNDLNIRKMQSYGWIMEFADSDHIPL